MRRQYNLTPFPSYPDLYMNRLNTSQLLPTSSRFLDKPRQPRQTRQTRQTRQAFRQLDKDRAWDQLDKGLTRLDSPRQASTNQPRQRFDKALTSSTNLDKLDNRGSGALWYPAVQMCKQRRCLLGECVREQVWSRIQATRSALFCAWHSRRDCNA